MLSTATKLCAPVIYRVPVDQSSRNDYRFRGPNVHEINLQSSYLPEIIQRCGGGDFQKAVGKRILLGPDGGASFGLFEIKSCTKRASKMTMQGEKSGFFYGWFPSSPQSDHSDYWVDLECRGSWSSPRVPEAALVLELLVGENDMRVEYFHKHIKEVDTAWQELQKQLTMFDKHKKRLEDSMKVYARALENERNTRMEEERNTRMVTRMLNNLARFLQGVSLIEEGASQITSAVTAKCLQGAGLIDEGAAQILIAISDVVSGCMRRDPLEALHGAGNVLTSDKLTDVMTAHMKKLKMGETRIENRRGQHRSVVGTTRVLADLTASWKDTTAELHKAASSQFGRTVEEREVISRYMDLQECLGRLNFQMHIYEMAVTNLSDLSQEYRSSGMLLAPELRSTTN